jgi:hypothetical protein
VWSTHRVTARKRSNFVVGDVNPECLEPFNDLWIAPVSTVTQGFESFIEGSILPVKKVAENMQL